MDLVSVIVPVYKVEKYLDRCVESIVNQTYRNLEIILVDDGSPDHCPAMCDAWAEKDSHIRVIHKPNGGLSDARNAGMAVANGEYISFIDSDDWIAPQFYEKLLEAIKRDGSDIAACSVEMVWEDAVYPGRLLTNQINCILDREAAVQAILEESILKQPVWYKIYKRELIEDIEFRKGKCHEDDYWSYQIIDRAKAISLLDYIGYFYWQRADSIMGKGYNAKRLDEIGAYCERCDFYKNKENKFYQLSLLILWERCIYHGSMVREYFDQDERKKAIIFLKSVLKHYPISEKTYRNEKISHRLWIDIARISFPLVCEIKYRLKIGR